MPQYQVRIDRTSVRTHIFTIEADTFDKAFEKALDQAGDHCFSDCCENGVEYDGEVLSEVSEDGS